MSSSGMKVKVKTVRGDTIAFDISLLLSIEGLKAIIAEEIPVVPCDQRLILSGRELEDSRRCFHYNVKEGDTIHLAVWLCGERRTPTWRGRSRAPPLSTVRVKNLNTLPWYWYKDPSTGTLRSAFAQPVKIPVDNNTYVEEVMVMIRDYFLSDHLYFSKRVPKLENMYLTFLGKRLRHGRTCADCGIQNGDVLFVLSPIHHWDARSVGTSKRIEVLANSRRLFRSIARYEAPVALCPMSMEQIGRDLDAVFLVLHG